MRSLRYLYRTMGPAKTGNQPVTAISPRPATETRKPANEPQAALSSPAGEKILQDLR